MESICDLVKIININNEKIDSQEIISILVLFEFPQLIVGDTVIQLSKLRLIRELFKNASITMNFKDRSYYSFTKENPFINQTTFLTWDDINYNEYNLILITYPIEIKFINFIQSILNKLDIRKLRILSVFPKCDGIHNIQLLPWIQLITDTFIPQKVFSKCTPNEIFISAEERHWADIWLMERGLKNEENLVILLDSSRISTKLVTKPVFFQLVEYFSQKKNVKILIFDENNQNKKTIFKLFLKTQTMEKIIFAEGVSLRDSFCLISSHFLKFILGPCTGILHCASGIYNVILNNGLTEKELPIMITYTGRYIAEDTQASYWWENSLVDCLVLRKNIHNSAEIMNLKQLTCEEAAVQDNFLSCKSYSSKLLIDYIVENYEEKSKLFKLNT